MCSYAGLRYAQIPVETYTCDPFNSTNPIYIDVNSTSIVTYCTHTSDTLKITVSFPVYVIAIVTWIGWFPLMVFLGIGLTALPLDFINEWRFRPIPMKEDEFN
jgi:LMBR1 domain-containing protein 1